MRKSREKRIADTRATLDAYRAAGLVSDNRVRFMTDMLRRLERGKGTSTKQRAWLDSLCAEGVPAPKGDPKLLARIDAAVDHSTLKGAEILRDFRGRVVRGWKLSPKQVAFMEHLLVEAVTHRDCGPYVPADDLLAEAVFAATLITGRGTTYKTTHPGVTRAAERILNWVAASEQVDQGTLDALPREFRLAEGDLKWLVSKVGKGNMEHHRNPKHAEGAPVWVPRGSEWCPQRRRHVSKGYAMGLVVGPPVPVAGRVAYPILADGILREFGAADIKKLRPKGWQGDVPDAC